MEEKRKKVIPSMSTIMIALSVFIIAESIWLVGKLEEISKETASNRTIPSSQEVVREGSAAMVLLTGPAQAAKGEEFPVQVVLKADEAFVSYGLDVVLNYDSEILEVLDTAKIDPQSPFKTAGLNFVEEDKQRVLVTLIDLSGEGFSFEAGGEYPLFNLQLRALSEGEVSVGVELDQEKSRKTQIMEAKTDELLLLDKEDLTVVIL